MSKEKYRSRCHVLLLYPDCAAHVEAIKKIEQSYDYALILHDKDSDENGELKKAHWHVVLRFGQAVWNTAVCKDLGIEENYLEKPRSFDNALLYLVHFNDSDKYQYDVSEVKGSLQKRLYEKMNAQEKTEGEKVHDLIVFIKEYEGCLSVTEFAEYCALHGYWAEFRRSGAIFVNIIKEHNDTYTTRERA